MIFREIVIFSHILNDIFIQLVLNIFKIYDCYSVVVILFQVFLMKTIIDYLIFSRD
jgi:hypothetical protein